MSNYQSPIEKMRKKRRRLKSKQRYHKTKNLLRLGTRDWQLLYEGNHLIVTETHSKAYAQRVVRKHIRASAGRLDGRVEEVQLPFMPAGDCHYRAVVFHSDPPMTPRHEVKSSPTNCEICGRSQT